MSGIFNGLQAILDGILGPLKIVIYFIKNIGEYLTLVSATLGTITTNIATIPDFIKIYVILSIGIIIIMRILGRSTK